MGTSLTLDSPAKINLHLAVLGRRPDGYHDIETVFQTVSLADRVTVELAGRGVAVTADDPALPRDEANLAGRAARALLDAVGRAGTGVRIHIAKRIPVGAGLGGGSGDAATTLIALDRLLGTGLGSEGLEAIGATIGSDVPFLVRGGTAIGRGRGEILTRLAPAPPAPILLAKPPISVSTRWAYEQLGEQIGTPLTAPRPLPIIADCLGVQEVDLSLARSWNAFEGVVFQRHPEVREIKESMLAGGAVGALMTGSGPTVFGVFADHAGMRESESSLRSRSCWVACVAPVGERRIEPD